MGLLAGVACGSGGGPTPTPTPPTTTAASTAAGAGFLMAVEDVFTITGRGTAITGRVERGYVRPGDTVEIVGITTTTAQRPVLAIEAFHQTVAFAGPGDSIGVLLSIDKDEVSRGQVLATPGSVSAGTDFTATVYMLTKDEGGRHTPFFATYKPDFRIRTAQVTGTVGLPDGTDLVLPGATVTLDIHLNHPVVVEPGLQFAVIEGDRRVGVGTVTAVQSAG